MHSILGGAMQTVTPSRQGNQKGAGPMGMGYQQTTQSYSSLMSAAGAIGSLSMPETRTIQVK